MNKNVIFLLVGLAFGFLVTIAATKPESKPSPIKPVNHWCIDPTHQYCDGQCECDGMGCGSAINNEMPLLRSYQLQIVDDNTIFVYDGFRFVGKLKFGRVNALDKMIMRDNE